MFTHSVGDASKRVKRDSVSRGIPQRIPSGGTPGYAVADLRFGFRCNAAWSLVAACENVMDKDYRIHGSGSNEPGRNLVLSAEYRF